MKRRLRKLIRLTIWLLYKINGLAYSETKRRGTAESLFLFTVVLLPTQIGWLLVIILIQNSDDVFLWS